MSWNAETKAEIKRLDGLATKDWCSGYPATGTLPDMMAMSAPRCCAGTARRRRNNAPVSSPCLEASDDRP